MLLRKGVYPYAYSGEWEKFNEITLPEKEEFQSNLSLEGITDTGFMYAKRDCKGFEIKSIDEYVICILKVIHNFWLMLSKSSKKKKLFKIKSIDEYVICYITFAWCFPKVKKKLFKSLSFRSCKISFSS